MATTATGLERLGKYRLIEQVGRGGMASVFRATDQATDREVAIKVLSPVLAQEEQFTKRFEREAEVVMRLSHPNIVPVIDYGQDAGYAYLVMPLLKVGSLADRLAEGPLTPAEGGRLLTQLSQALQFAHDRGVIHRDVKPSNVLMDEHGSALLADFGLARIHDASVSLTGSALLGTPAYMSPEQARGEKVGPASDQYSLGVILYQLCTGNLPFEAETPMAVMLKHINEPVPLAREKAPNVPEAIEHVILKATAKLPEQRFGSVSELSAAFQAALAHARDPFANPAPRIELPPSSVAGQPGAARELGPVQIVPNVPRRSRLARLAGAAAVLLLLALACPAAYLGYSGRLNGASGPAEGSSLLSDDMSDSQLTALAGTIVALSTELAAAGGGTQSPEQIQTAVMGTLSAGGDPLGEATETPGPFVIGGGTPTATASPGPSPTPSLSPTPGPSPTPSKTPTITQTPSPGPSPTPSTTPTLSKTPTPSATASLGPSTTPTPTSTSTSNASPLPSKTPSPTPTATTSSVIPTDPPAIDPCENISILGYIFSPPVVGVEIYNGNVDRIELEWIRMEWPPPNLKLQKFDLAGEVIWDEGDTVPPTFATNLSGNRKIEGGSSKPLVAVFALVIEDYYEVEVGFTNGCTVYEDTG